MNEIKFLLDTNIVIGLLKQGLSILPNQNITFANSAISQITRIELLSFPRITVDPDAIIIATAQTYHLELITLDNKMKVAYQLAIK